MRALWQAMRRVGATCEGEGFGLVCFARGKGCPLASCFSLLKVLLYFASPVRKTSKQHQGSRVMMATAAVAIVTCFPDVAGLVDKVIGLIMKKHSGDVTPLPLFLLADQSAWQAVPHKCGCVLAVGRLGPRVC